MMKCKHKIKFIGEYVAICEGSNNSVRADRVTRFYGELPLMERKKIDVKYSDRNCSEECDT
jgi:hypothetical protein